MRQIKRRKIFVLLNIVTFGFLIFFAGCKSVGTEYKHPDLSGQYNENWANQPQKGKTTSLTQNMPKSKWWQQFKDAELENLVTRLFKTNLDLSIAQERIIEAYTRRGVVNADKMLQVDIDAFMRRAGTGEDAVNFQGPSPGEESEVFSIEGLASWKLDLWGRVDKMVQAADKDIDAEFKNYDSLLVSLAAELGLGYIDARTYEERIYLLDKHVALLKKSLELSQLRFDMGYGTKLDVMQAKQLFDKVKSDLPTLIKAKKQAYNRICVIVGMTPSDKVIKKGNLPKPPDMVGIGVPADLITRRADVRAAEMQYAAAIARVGAAIADKYPRISLTGSLIFQTDAPSNLFQPDGLIYSIGPKLHFPLFDGHRIDQTILVRKSQAEQARLNIKKTLLYAVREVEDAAVSVIQNQKHVEYLEKTADDVRQSVELANQLYKSGLGSMMQLIDTQRELVSIEDMLVVARQNELKGIITLYRALGGGWEAIYPKSEHTIPFDKGEVKNEQN